MQKAFNNSVTQLEEVLPLEVTARWFAQTIYLEDNLNCTYFISQVCANDTRCVNEVCTKFDFSDVSQLKTFINGTWYGDYYWN